MSYQQLALVTCAALGGAMIAQQALPELLDMPVRIGNCQTTALPVMRTENCTPKLVGLENALAFITELQIQSQCIEEQNSLIFLKNVLRNSGATHFWVA